jgi:hypothetical protein
MTELEFRQYGIIIEYTANPTLIDNNCHDNVLYPDLVSTPSGVRCPSRAGCRFVCYIKLVNCPARWGESLVRRFISAGIIVSELVDSQSVRTGTVRQSDCATNPDGDTASKGSCFMNRCAIAGDAGSIQEMLLKTIQASPPVSRHEVFGHGQPRAREPSLKERSLSATMRGGVRPWFQNGIRMRG